MDGKSVVAGVLVVVMGAAWWWTLSESGVGPAPPPRTGRAATTTTVPPEVALRRLAQTPTAEVHRGGRDPFGGEAPASNAAVLQTAARAQAATLGDAAPVVAAPAWPRLSLIGVGERTVDGVPARVAVLAGEQGVLHASAGDVLMEVYRIDRVHTDGVDVRLIPEDRVFTLRLR